MDWESCRLPVGIGCMAGFTIVGYSQCAVIRIGGLIVIILMAIGTNRRSAAVAVFMAKQAINSCMSAS